MSVDFGTSSGVSTWSKGVTYDFASMKEVNFNAFNAYVEGRPVASVEIVPPSAEYIEAATCGGTCHGCGWIIQPGAPIWCRRDEQAMRSYIWCGEHKQYPSASPAKGRSKQHKEQDMAQRQDFTFPYTGAEIAAGLEAKAVKLESQIQGPVTVDRDTLVLAGYRNEKAQDQLIEEAEQQRASANETLTHNASRLRKEAIPYAKASKQEFLIDLDDINHFGLNDDEAPAAAPKKRIRRTKPAETADIAEAE